MKPGATTRPPASMVLFAVPEIFPTSAIFPCAIPMLACFAGAPVPSTTMPFLIRMSRAMRHDTTLVVVARHEVAAFPGKEVEVRAFVRLQHVIEIQAPVTACKRRLGLFPFPAPLRELLLRHEQLQAPLGDVELD